MADKHDQKPITDKDILIRGAAEALMSDPQVGKEIAGCTSANFVQVARRTFKQNGIDFTDSELRDVHEMLRELVVRKTMGGKGLNMSPN